MDENNEFMERWKNEREKGKLKYVLNENKVFLFIIVLIILIIVFSIGYFTQIYTGYTILTTQIVIKSLIISSPTWIVPICTSLKKWKENEKRYHELK